MRRVKIGFVLAVLIVLPCALGYFANPSATEVVAATSTRKSATLQQQLESGLKARRPEEFQFIRRVVLMVDQQKLPIDLVRSTFDWARKKRPYPFVFFERGLKIRAARIGILVQ